MDRKVYIWVYNYEIRDLDYIQEASFYIIDFLSLELNWIKYWEIMGKISQNIKRQDFSQGMPQQWNFNFKNTLISIISILLTLSYLSSLILE